MASTGLYEAKAPPPATSADAAAYSDNPNPASTTGTGTTTAASTYPVDKPTGGTGTGAYDQAAFDANNNNGVARPYTDDPNPPPPPPSHPALGTNANTNTAGGHDGGDTYLGTGTGTGAAPPARSASTVDRAKAYGQRGYDKFVKPGRENKGLGPEHNIWLALLAILLPPLAVFLRSGIGADFVINILLTILAWFPGILHAWFVIFLRSSGSGVERDTR